MSVQLAEFVDRYRPRLDQFLLDRLPLSQKPGTDKFNQAVYYAVFPGGKRMRPLFTLLAANTLGGDPDQTLPIACAIEYLHTCSLIFDDLPAMDNASDRRGKRPTHYVFGEDIAMLAGLALFNQGYALLGQTLPLEKARRLIEEMSNCIGPNGMIGGQVVDLGLRGSHNAKLRTVSYLKTTALMRLMASAGGIAAGAEDDRIHAMAAFGENLGDAYQMLDDIVDVDEDHAAASFADRPTDVLTLWQRANQKLGEARDGLSASLLNTNPALLLELVDNIFSKLKKQASDRLKAEKGDRAPLVQSARMQ